MARKLCTYCTFRPVSSDLLEGNICEACYDYQGHENTHSDESHETEGAQDDCLICQGAPDPETTPPAKGHSNGIAKSHTSHAACKHPKTKKDRAICRKARAAE
jgi:hypothetical protein